MACERSADPFIDAKQDSLDLWPNRENSFESGS